MDYEQGLEKLEEHARGKEWFQDFTLYEARLREYLSEERLFGPSEQIRTGRARVVDQLNALATQHLGKSFNELSRIHFSSPGVPSPISEQEQAHRAVARAILEPDPPPTDWVDRPQYFELKAALLGAGPVAMAIEGRGGLGKTALARKLAADPEIRHAYSDGVFWISLGRQPDATAMLMTRLATLAAALGRNMTGYSDLESRSSAVRSLLAGHKHLLIWDDVWKADEVDLAELLRQLGAAAALLTTRSHDVARSFAANQAKKPLAELTPDTSIELLKSLITRDDVDQAVLRRVAALAGGLPLYLKLLAELLDNHTRAGLSLDRLLTDLERRDWSVERRELRIIDKSIDELKDDREAFINLAVFAPRPASFDLPAAMAVWEVDEETAEERLRRFVSQYLVDPKELSRGRWGLHLSLYDAARAGQPEEYRDAKEAIRDRQSPHRRHAKYYLRLINRNRTDWRSIAAELDQIRCAWDTVALDPALTLGFVEAMQRFHKLQGFRRQEITWMETRGLAAARDLQEDLRQKPGTHAKRLLKLRRREGWLLHNIGWTYDSLGDRQQALKYLEDALRVWEEIDDPPARLTTLHTIGWVYSHGLGQYQEALKCLEEARSLAEATNNKHGLAVTLQNTGWTYDSLGEHERARQHLETAMQILKGRRKRDRNREAMILNALGWVYGNLGQPERALQCLEQAKSLACKHGDRGTEVNSLHTMGWVYSNGRGEHETALLYLEEALKLAEEIGDNAALSATLNNMGEAYAGLGKPAEAMRYLEEALQVRKKARDPRGQAVTLDNMAHVHEALGNLQEAQRCLVKAVALAREVNSADLPGIQKALARLREKLGTPPPGEAPRS